MKGTHLIAVLVGVIGMGIFAADASAFYHPGMGRFMQRDPGAGAAVRVGAGGPAVGGAFVPRDTETSPLADYPAAELADLSPLGEGGLGFAAAPFGHYQDGMNLYQYVLGDPMAHVDPTGLSSRRTKYWHARGYGAEKIKSGFVEVEHSVIAVDRSQTEGVDFGPPGKAKSGKKKVSWLTYYFGGEKGYTKPWTIQFKVDYARPSHEHQWWQLCIKDTETMKDPAGGNDIECKCAMEDQVKACIEAVAKEWNEKLWKSRHDCRDFVSAAESGNYPADGPFSAKGCCLKPCSP